MERDAFAAIAMHGLLSRKGPGEFDFDVHPADVLRVAAWAFDMGDTMIKFRNATDKQISKMFEDAEKSVDYREFVLRINERDKREEQRQKRLKTKQKPKEGSK